MTQQYIVDSYTFDSAAKTVTLPNLPNLRLEGLQLITNLTTGDVIYQFNAAAKGGTVSGNVLTLDYDTTAMSNTDKLQILYSPPTGGFFDRALYLMSNMIDAIKFPAWIHGLGGFFYVRTLSDANSTLATVTTVTTVSTVTNLTNLNTIDSRELIWSLWDTEYNTGIRNKIT